MAKTNDTSRQVKSKMEQETSDDCSFLQTEAKAEQVTK